MSFLGTLNRTSQLLNQEMLDLKIFPARKRSWNPNVLLEYLPGGNGLQSRPGIQTGAMDPMPSIQEQEAVQSNIQPLGLGDVCDGGNLYASMSSVPPTIIQSHPEVADRLNRKGKIKRIRTSFTTTQLLELEAVFKKASYVSIIDRNMLSNRLGVTDRAIKVWFQNRRMKQKKKRYISSDEESLTSPEVGSTTTDPPVEPQFTKQHFSGGYEFPTNFKSNLDSLKVQNTCAPTIPEFQAFCQQHRFNQLLRTSLPNPVNTLETHRCDSESPLQYYSKKYVDTNENGQAPSFKLLSSTASVLGASATLNNSDSKIEINFASNDDAAMDGMNMVSLDKQCALVSSCFTSDIVDISSDDTIIYEPPTDLQNCKHVSVSNYFDSSTIEAKDNNHVKQVNSGQSFRDFFKRDPKDISIDVILESSRES